MIANDQGDSALKLQVLLVTLRAHADMQSDVDPAQLLASIEREVQRLSEASGDRLFGQSLATLRAQSLFDAASIEQGREANSKALNCERLHRFADVSSVEAYLDELRTRAGGPFVAELPRRPGSRQARWMHLLSGPPDPAALAEPAHAAVHGDAVSAGEIAAIKRNVDDLAREVAGLKSALARVMEELGIAR